MSQHDEELLNAIDKMINERTFSLEAVEAVKNMREDLKETKFMLEKAAKRVIKLEDDLEKKSADYDNTDRALRAYEEREKKLVERENKILYLECTVEKHMSVRDAYINCFQTVFKNTIIREEIQKQVVTPLEGTPGMAGNMGTSGYGQKDDVSERKETTKE